MNISEWRNNLKEVWKPIPDYEGYYEVSNTGKIRSVNHERKAYHGSYVMKGRELKPSFGNSGYLQVGLSKLGKTKNFMIHRIVARVFIVNDNPKCKIAVNHIDGNKVNNNADNLEWVSYSDNQKHAYANGLNSWNPRKGRPSKPVVQISIDTGKARAVYESLGEAKRAVGAKGSHSSIMRCCRGDKRYKTAHGFKWMFKEDYENMLHKQYEI